MARLSVARRAARDAAAASPRPPPRSRRPARPPRSTTTRSPARRRRCARKPVAHALVERDVLGLEPVGAPAGRAREAQRGVDVEQDGDVGHEPAGRPVVERADLVEVEPAAVALVRERRVGEAVAHDARRPPRGAGTITCATSSARLASYSSSSARGSSPVVRGVEQQVARRGRPRPSRPARAAR